MKIISILISFLFLQSAFAAEKMNMNFNNEELSKIIESYSKASGQKFVVDPGVRGRVTILMPEQVNMEEAFNQLSQALAINGFGISKQGDTMVIKSARNIQRDLVEVSTSMPTLQPQRMYTWVYNVKNIPAESINRDIRMLTSKDGELSVSMRTNQLLITDWTSNLIRIGEVLKQLDKPVDPSVAKIVEASRKEWEAHRKDQTAHKKSEKNEKSEKSE